MGMVFAAAELDGTEKLLLLGYTNYTDPHGYCWPSEDRLADDCGTSRSTVQRAKRKLAARNLLKSVRRVHPQTGDPISNLTRINLPLLASMARNKVAYGDDLINAISFDDDSQGDPASTLAGTPELPEPTSELLKGHFDSGYESNRRRPGVNMKPTQSQNDSQSRSDPLGNQPPPSLPVPGPRGPEKAVGTREGGREAAPLNDQEQAAVAALARVQFTEPRLTLGEVEILRLAPLAATWLARSTEDAMRDALTAGLPGRVESPAGLVRRRLVDKLPPELPRAARVGGGLPTWCGACDGPEAARRFVETEADGWARCPNCHPAALAAVG